MRLRREKRNETREKRKKTVEKMRGEDKKTYETR